MLDDVVALKLGPQDKEPFWGASESTLIPGASIVNPATPGRPFKL